MKLLQFNYNFAIIVVVSILLFSLFSACQEGDKYFISQSFSLHDAPASGHKIFLVKKGERVYKLKDKLTKPGWSKVKLKDGSVGYALNRYLAKKVLVCTNTSLELKSRPGPLAPRSASATNLKLASVVFVSQEIKSKKEGTWYEIQGGYTRGNYFRGWVPATGGFDDDSDLVGYAIDLEHAIIKKDLVSLKKLTDTYKPVSIVAADMLDKFKNER